MIKTLLLLLCTLSLYAPYTIYDATGNFLKALQAYQANQNADTAQALVDEYDNPKNTDKYRRIFDSRLQRAKIDLNALKAQAAQRSPAPTPKEEPLSSSEEELSKDFEEIDTETEKWDTETLDELAKKLQQPALANTLIQEAEKIAQIAQEQANIQVNIIEKANEIADLETTFKPIISTAQMAGLGAIAGRNQPTKSQLEQTLKNVRSNIEYSQKLAKLQLDANQLEAKIAELQSKKLDSELKIKNIEQKLLEQREQVLNNLLSKKHPNVEALKKHLETEIKKLETRDGKGTLKAHGQKSLMRQRQLLQRINSWQATSSEAKETAKALLAEQSTMSKIQNALEEAGKSLQKNVSIQQALTKSLPPLQTPAPEQPAMAAAEAEAKKMIETVHEAFGKGAEKVNALVDLTTQKIGTPAEMAIKMQDNFRKASERLIQQQNALKMRSSRMLAQAGQRASQASAAIGAEASAKLQPQLSNAAQNMNKLTTRLGQLADSPAVQQAARRVMRIAMFIAK